MQQIDARRLRVVGFIKTPLDAHGLYVSRDTQDLYDRPGGGRDHRGRLRRPARRGHVEGAGQARHGGVSPDGRVLWVSGRYSGAVYAISAQTGRVIANIPVGVSPHGLCAWPQPGRYSTAHTGVMR